MMNGNSGSVNPDPANHFTITPGGIPTMSLTTPITLLGVPGSPYTRKMLAVLRYRRITYQLILASHRVPPAGLPRAKVPLLPTFYLPGPSGALEAVTDSTPIIRLFEREFSGRSVIPTDPAMAFINDLLEDYGDEWLTKAMFHYRWYYKADIDHAGDVLPLWSSELLSDADFAKAKQDIIERQVSRLYVVGSNDTTARVIEDSYRRYLGIMEEHFRHQRYVLGERPSSADFAAYGQLTQLTKVDPTPMALTRREAPRVNAWVDRVDDLSGLEPQETEWTRRDAIAQSLRELLGEVGRGYVPVMLANEKALADGAAEVRTEVEGKTWVQKPFPYQAKCLKWLRESYRALSPADRSAVDGILRGTGCERLFA
jgi:glutathione S-transferase